MRLHRPQGLVLRGLHLLVLCGFAVAQPLFDLLSGTPEFFVVRGSTSLDIVAAGLGLALVPPAALLAVEALAGLLHPRAQAAVHLVFVGALSGLIALQALGRLDDSQGWPLVGAAAVLGALAAAAYKRFAPLRSLITVLAPAPFVFLALFLASSPIQALRLQGEAEAGSRPVVDSRIPVVMIVFDEFPLTSLLDAEGHVDADRFPNFSRLAQEATWFRNATTVHEHTTAAVPSILTGEYPEANALPLLDDHPRNVFTYLARSYRMHVLEPATQLCPSDVCERRRPRFSERMQSLLSDLQVVYLHVTLPEKLADDLPPIDETWQDFGADGASVSGGAPLADTNVAGRLWRDPRLQFEQWVSEIGPGEARRPTFHFVHTLLPHRPWRYLPSGKRYANAAARGVDKGPGQPHQWLLTQDYQQHLLQVGFFDRLLGITVDRLRESGLYDRSLIVVAADHGASFRLGGSRRRVSPTNIADIAVVPLFVKRPAQKRGEIVNRNVRTIDILPTIAEVLGTPLPGPVDGRSLFDRAAPGYSTVTVHRTAGDPVSAPAAEVEAC